MLTLVEKCECKKDLKFFRHFLLGILEYTDFYHTFVSYPSILNLVLTHRHLLGYCQNILLRFPLFPVILLTIQENNQTWGEEGVSVGQFILFPVCQREWT